MLTFCRKMVFSAPRVSWHQFCVLGNFVMALQNFKLGNCTFWFQGFLVLFYIKMSWNLVIFSLEVCLDYVNVYDIIDGVPKLKKTLCGKGTPLPIQSVSNKLLVKFRSDHMLNNPGFNATFRTKCEHIFSVLLLLLYWFGI